MDVIQEWVEWGGRREIHIYKSIFSVILIFEMELEKISVKDTSKQFVNTLDQLQPTPLL